MQNLLPGPSDFRNGLYRAASVFVTPLSFGEFEIIVIPIGLFFALHRERLLDRALGWAAVFGGVVGIYCSGSRGGWVGIIASVSTFVAIWSIRDDEQGQSSPCNRRLRRAIAFAAVIGGVMFVGRVHTLVLGGRPGRQHGRSLLSVAGRTSVHQVKSDHWARSRAWRRHCPKLNRQLRAVASRRDRGPRARIFRRIAPASSLVRRAELPL